MKLNTYAFLAAALACGMANAQTAYTTPVGYVTLTIPASADSTVTPPLSRAPLFQGASTGISGNVVTVAATGAASNAWINGGGNTNAKTYLLVRSGALAGLRFPVSANDGTTITVVGGDSTLQAQGFVLGDLVSVEPYWTLATLFPAGAGVGASQDIYDPLAYLIVSDQSSTGVNRGAGGFFFYADGTDGNPAGWRDANDAEGDLQDTYPIDPSITYTIRTGSVGQTLTVAGQVPDSAISTRVLTAATANDEYLTSPFPVDISLAESNLQTVIAASSDIYDPTEFVLVYSDESAGFNKGASAFYFYHNGADGNPAGWKDLNDPEGPNVAAKVLKAGRGFTLRKASGTPASTIWKASLPYSL
jgi:uncharacterized protein (TIGR02597 family)